jgi:hypothetical protein
VLYFFSLEPTAIRHWSVLPLDKKLLITTPTCGHKLVIKYSFDLVTRWDMRWKVGRRGSSLFFLGVACISGEIFYIEYGANGQICRKLQVICIGPQPMENFEWACTAMMQLVYCPLGKRSGRKRTSTKSPTSKTT